MGNNETIAFRCFQVLVPNKFINNNGGERLEIKTALPRAAVTSMLTEEHDPISAIVKILSVHVLKSKGSSCLNILAFSKKKKKVFIHCSEDRNKPSSGSV